jgi:hypothetical protein
MRIEYNKFSDVQVTSSTKISKQNYMGLYSFRKTFGCAALKCSRKRGSTAESINIEFECCQFVTHVTSCEHKEKISFCFGLKQKTRLILLRIKC